MIIQTQIYNAANKIIYNTEVLKSSLCNNNDAYILVRGDITITGHKETQVAFKNWAPFTKCITKIDETTIDDAEDLDLVMPMYNLIKHSSNYSETTESLWFCSKDESTNFLIQILLMITILNLSCIRKDYYKTLNLIERMKF